MHQFFLLHNNITDRYKRTEKDLKTLDQLNKDLIVFFKLAKEAEISNQNDKLGIFVALKDIGRTICNLSMRQGDFVSANPEIPWTELTAMAVYFQRWYDNKEFEKLNQQQFLAISQELELLSEIVFTEPSETHLNRKSIKNLENLKVTQAKVLEENKKLLQLIEHYKNLSILLEDVYLQINYISYDLSDEAFKKQYLIEIETKYKSMQEILDKINETELPEHLKQFLFTTEHEKKIKDLKKSIESIFKKYESKARNKLIQSIKECNEMLVDQKGLLKKDINPAEKIFTDCRFMRDVDKNNPETVSEAEFEIESKFETVMSTIKEMIQKPLDMDNIDLIINAIQKLSQSQIKDSMHFRASVLYVLVMLGENCKAFSKSMKERLPKELLISLAILRDNIIHATDEFKGRLVIEDLLKKDSKKLLTNIVEELDKIAVVFKNCKEENTRVEEVINYDLEKFNRLKEELNKPPEPHENSKTSFQYPGQSLVYVLQNYIDEDVLKNTDPCHVFAVDFYMVYCGELARSLEFNQLFNEVANEDIKFIIEKLIKTRGELAHQLAARGIDQKNLVLFCQDLKNNQTEFQYVCYAMKLSSAISKHQSACFSLLAEYTKLINQTNRDVTNLGSKTTKNQENSLKPIKNGLEIFENRLKSFKSFSMPGVSKEKLKEVFSNSLKPDEDQSKKNLPIEKLPDNSAKKILIELEKKPHKIFGFHVEKEHKKLKKEYLNICKEFLMIESEIKNFQNLFLKDLEKMLESSESLRLRLEFTLSSLDKIRDFNQFFNGYFVSEKSKLLDDVPSKNIKNLVIRTKEATESDIKVNRDLNSYYCNMHFFYFSKNKNGCFEKHFGNVLDLHNKNENDIKLHSKL